MADHWNFNPQTALDYAAAMARPRLVGSGEEEKVAQEIAERLERFGYRVERQPFRFSEAFNTVIALEVFTSLILILIAFWQGGSSGRVSLGVAALIIIVAISSGPLNRAVRAAAVAPETGEPASRFSTMCLRVARQYMATNLIARLPDSPPDPNRPHLYLVAHYDSKSQIMPLIVRIALFVLTIAGGLAFAALTLASFAVPQLGAASAVVGAIALIAGVPLLFLDVGNASPGAIDNASGAGVTLHLAECLAARPELRARLNWTILIFSAEELAVMGSTHYALRNEAVLRAQAASGGLALLNFDGVGMDGKLYLVEAGYRGERRSSRLPGLIRAACSELQIDLGMFGLPGALFDHVPFAERGFDAASLIAIGRATPSIHTRGDSADKLHPRGFEQAGWVALGVIEKLATIE